MKAINLNIAESHTKQSQEDKHAQRIRHDEVHSRHKNNAFDSGHSPSRLLQFFRRFTAVADSSNWTIYTKCKRDAKFMVPSCGTRGVMTSLSQCTRRRVVDIGIHSENKDWRKLRKFVRQGYSKTVYIGWCVGCSNVGSQFTIVCICKHIRKFTTFHC